MNLGAFGVLIWIRNRRTFAYTLDEIGGLGRTMPWAAILMALFMISLTGIPPTIGFWGKFYLFTAVVHADLTWLAIVAVIMSSVSAFYYLRVVWYMYFREAPEGSEVEAEPASSQLGVISAVEPGGGRRARGRPVPRAAAQGRRRSREADLRRLTRARRAPCGLASRRHPRQRPTAAVATGRPRTAPPRRRARSRVPEACRGTGAGSTR